jgi:hypothetical protein
MSKDEEVIKERCRESFGECWRIAGDKTISRSLFLWLKENYQNLCDIQAGGRTDIQTELRWSLEDDADYRAIYLEESMWMNPLMSAEELLDEADSDTHSAVTMMAIIQNPNCPKSIITEMASITIDDCMWLYEKHIEALNELAQELLQKMK